MDERLRPLFRLLKVQNMLEPQAEQAVALAELMSGDWDEALLFSKTASLSFLVKTLREVGAQDKKVTIILSSADRKFLKALKRKHAAGKCLNIQVSNRS